MRTLILGAALLLGASTRCSGEVGPILPDGGRMTEMPPGCHTFRVAYVEPPCWALACAGEVRFFYDLTGRTYDVCPM